MSTSARILLVRHASAKYETDGNGDSGGSLTPEGRDAALSLGRRLAALRPGVVLSSELSRAVQTAEIMAATIGVSVEVRTGLEEYDVGSMRGREYDADVFEPLLRDWREGRLSTCVPGGEDGITVAKRVFAVLDEVPRRYPGETVIVVSHGGAINAVLGAIGADGEVLPSQALELAPCAFVELTKQDRTWRCVPTLGD